MKMYFGAGLKIPPGRKRMVFILTAIDVNNVRRPNGICFEIKGEFVKV